MDEEPIDNELEERLYAMLHHVDETQTNVNTANQNNAVNILENASQSTVRRYWRSSSDQSTPYQKVNTPKENVPAPALKHSITTTVTYTNSKPKEEKCNASKVPSADLSLFQSQPLIVKKTIEILDHETNNSVFLDSSDEDEVIEVELPPKPTITIESSDEDEVFIVPKQDSPSKNQNKPNVVSENTALVTVERDVSASPVPSVVSSVSDEFIRGDCIALNISSKHHDNHSFDFSLHGSDLLGQVTPSKKKKKKKSKEITTSTPVSVSQEKPINTEPETCFATPKSKAKNKKQKSKSYVVSKKSVPSADVYDSDSNQSVIETNKDLVTDKTLPNADVYESDSSQPEASNEIMQVVEYTLHSSDRNISLNKPEQDTTKKSKKDDSNITNRTDRSTIDLTDSDDYITLDNSGITESIFMANVSGFQESEDYGEEPMLHGDALKLGSTKVPQILFENLDFDNLKGKDKVCKQRKYSLSTLRAEMEKFYNESWGGEDFNHREIQKYMSRDKSLWVIDPKDRMPSLSKRKATCNYCNRPGHRDDNCRMKPAVCYMCGSPGHFEPRCPSKICVNCGSPNHMYSTMCRNCSWWSRATCSECGQPGHPPTHCPDLWRRYHNTIDNNSPLVENRQLKKNHQLHCSGCTRRGHLVHTCRISLPFSGLPMYSPYVSIYRPVYFPSPPGPAPAASAPALPRPDRPKRLSKSPMHETHLNKKKNLAVPDTAEERNDDHRQRKNSQTKSADDKNKTDADGRSIVEPAPDFIPILSANRDKKGHLIQDNEVSDTSDVVTSARIYVTNDIAEQLKSDEGSEWLEGVMLKHDVAMESSDVNSLLSIRGKVACQEAFQTALREWTGRDSSKDKSITNVESDHVTMQGPENDKPHCDNIPRKKHLLMRKLKTDLHSLNYDHGDPEAIYRELNYLQNNHEKLLKKKCISLKQLSKNREHINEMLKKLNMVLLGQAGLADGPAHVRKLHALLKTVANYQHKSISPDLRSEVGLHYHTIFTSIPRNDYAELLKMYRIKHKDKILHQKNKLQFKPPNRKERKKKRKSKPAAENMPVQGSPAPIQANQGAEQEKAEPLNMSYLQKLTFSNKRIKTEQASAKKTKRLTEYLPTLHKRVMAWHPADSILKKMRVVIARKLHSCILTLQTNEKVSLKALRKMAKVQKQATVCLRSGMASAPRERRRD